jgi:hypothetical protein
MALEALEILKKNITSLEIATEDLGAILKLCQGLYILGGLCYDLT